MRGCGTIYARFFEVTGSPTPSSQPRVSVAGDTFAPRLLKKALGGAVGAVVVLIYAMPARALVTGTVLEEEGNVVMRGSGTLNVSALTYRGTIGIDNFGIDPRTSTFLINPGPQISKYQGQFTLPANLGPGPANCALVRQISSEQDGCPVSGSGDSFGIIYAGDEINYYNPDLVPTLWIPPGSRIDDPDYAIYAISGTSTYVGQTFTSLGLTPRSYTWSWGSGGTADSITMQIGNSAAPGPASVPGPLPILGLAAAFGFSRKLRKRIKLHKGTSDISTSAGA